MISSQKEFNAYINNNLALVNRYNYYIKEASLENYHNPSKFKYEMIKLVDKCFEFQSDQWLIWEAKVYNIEIDFYNV